MTFLLKKAMLGVWSVLLVTQVLADSPPSIETDILWTDSGGVGDSAAFGGVGDVMQAFNNARRQEEIQLNLAADTLGKLRLPSQAVWDTLSYDEKGLYILNAERMARDGMVNGVIGLPFAGVESTIDGIAEDYAQLLHDSNARGHYQPSGNSSINAPSIRIGSNAVIGDTASRLGGSCREFINQFENLAYFAHFSSVPFNENPMRFPVEFSIYSWIYANASSNWGHRTMVLLQDKDIKTLNPLYGYTSPGYIGIGVRSTRKYRPFEVPAGFHNWGTVVVFNVFEPLSAADNRVAACQYDVTVRSSDLSLPN